MKHAIGSDSSSSVAGWLEEWDGLEGILNAHGVGMVEDLLAPGAKRRLQESIPRLGDDGHCFPDDCLVFTLLGSRWRCIVLMMMLA